MNLADARRDLVALTGAQAFSAAGPPIIISLGGLVGQMIAPYKALATLPVSLYTIGLALATIPVSHLIVAYGRRSTYQFTSMLAIVAGIVAAYGIATQSFVAFCAATLLAGINGACVQTYRFAAAELVEAPDRAQAISFVMVGGLIAAVIGPQTVIWTRDAIADVPFAGSFLAQSALAIFGLIAVSVIRTPPVMVQSKGEARSVWEVARTPRFIMAAGAGMVSYGIMGFMMTAAPIAMVGCGHTIGEAALGIQWHVLAMFGPSVFTGRLLKRFGDLPITVCGLVVLVLSAMVALSDENVAGFWIALILLGVGWNFGFLGATSMVANCCPPNERAKVQGLNDFLVFGALAVASLSSGGFMQAAAGWSNIAWVTIVVVTLMLLQIAYVSFQSRKTQIAGVG